MFVVSEQRSREAQERVIFRSRTQAPGGERQGGKEIGGKGLHRGCVVSMETGNDEKAS